MKHLLTLEDIHLITHCLGSYKDRRHIKSNDVRPNDDDLTKIIRKLINIRDNQLKR